MEVDPLVAKDLQLDAERAVLGSLLIDSGITRQVLATVREDDFYMQENRFIFQAARAVFRSGMPVDGVTVRNQIGSQYTDYLMQLVEITPTSASWEVYAQLMREQATLRRAHQLAHQVLATTTMEAYRPLSAQFSQLTTDRRGADAWNTREMFEDFFVSQDPEQPAVEYITCGFKEIDNGSFLTPGDVMIIGGYPSDGKTAMALTLAYHMAATKSVGFFSLETDRRKVRDRLMSHVVQIDLGAIKHRRLDEEAWKAVADKGAEFTSRGLTVLEAPGLTVPMIASMSEAYGFDIIFIDYVQLVESELGKRMQRSEQMADVSRSLHIFAQQSKTLVVELAQLSRQERSSGWREPTMQDLKESGQFEQDADIIFMVYRPNPKSEDLNQEDNRILNIVKNKEGRRGKWPLAFDGEKQTFRFLPPDILRKLVAAGKRAKSGNNNEEKPVPSPMEAVPEYVQTEFTEIADGDPKSPF